MSTFELKTIDFYWIDIFGAAISDCGWPKYPGYPGETNCEYIQKLMDTMNKKGMKFGFVGVRPNW